MVKSIFHYAQKMRPFNFYRLSEKKCFDKNLRYAFLILGQRYDIELMISTCPYSSDGRAADMLSVGRGFISRSELKFRKP